MELAHGLRPFWSLPSILVQRFLQLMELLRSAAQPLLNSQHALSICGEKGLRPWAGTPIESTANPELLGTQSIKELFHAFVAAFARKNTALHLLRLRVNADSQPPVGSQGPNYPIRMG